MLKLFILSFIFIMLGGQAFSEEKKLVAWWSMDECKGDILYDKTGNGNNGKIFNAIPTSGKEGKALEFNGINSYIDCGNNPSINLGKAISIEAWVKLKTTQGGGVVSKYNKEGGYFLCSSWQDNGYPYWFLRKSPSTLSLLSPRKKLSLNTWHHIVGTAETGKELKLYIDGALQGAQHLLHTFENKEEHLIIGKYKNTFFNGIIDEIKIYNYALPEKEIINNKIKISEQKIQSLKNTFDKTLKRSKNLKDSETNNNWKSLIHKDLSNIDINEISKRIKGNNFIVSQTTKKELDKIEALLSQTNNILDSLENENIKTKDILTYITEPITAKMVLPNTPITNGKISNKLNITACPGEYEPASIVVTAFRKTLGLHLKCSDLTGKKGVIPGENIDIKVVKCWYQGGTAGINLQQDTRKTLVPELLLNNDNLIKVDYQKKNNYIKICQSDKENYICISNPNENNEIKDELKILPIKEFNIKDSSKLLPVDIPANSNKQFWITIKVPENAEAGIYNGKLHLFVQNKQVQTIEMTLNVLPFRLLDPYYTSSIYYRGKLAPDSKASISSELKSKLQFEKELENMIAHGVNNPTVYQGINDKLLMEVLKIRQKLNLNKKPLYYIGITTGTHSKGAPVSQEALATLKVQVEKLIKMAQQHGISDVYIYGIDEKIGKELEEQKAAWKTVHDLGGKIFVAGYKGKNFESMGKIQDLLICSGKPSKEEAAKWHSNNHKIWCYANPQGGVETPLVYRQNYGILLWQNNYDGACTFAYQFGMGNIWNDFDNRHSRDHNFTYPTVDGVIDTIEWEGYREGVDDARYLTTLKDEIKKAQKEKTEEKAKAIDNAEKYLAELKTADINKIDLNEMRLKIAEHIMDLRK